MIAFLFFIFFSNLVLAQQPGFQIVVSVPVKAEKITTDVFGNFYLFEGNHIQKFNIEGIPQGSFSSPFLGKPAYADATNPLRVLVFYASFNKIQWLDKSMSEMGAVVDLNEILQEQAAWVCSSSKGGFWALTEMSGKLHYFSENLSLKISQPLSEDCFLQTRKISGMIEKNEHLLIQCTDGVILCCDLFGNLLKKFTPGISTGFQSENGKIWNFGSRSVSLIHIETKETWMFVVPVADENSMMRIENQHIYILKPGMLEIYKMMFE